jgi:hypothetical protein
MALDPQFNVCVEKLEDISWVRRWDGAIYTRQPWEPIIVHGTKNKLHWTVLIAQQDWISMSRGWGKLRFVLTRWNYERGRYNLKNYMRLSSDDLKGLINFRPDLVELIETKANRKDVNY